MTSIWWIRRDVRLTDNPTLLAALQSGQVVPVFIMDSYLLAKSPLRRQGFLFNGLRVLHQQLLKLGSRLVVRRGTPEEVLSRLLIDFQAQAIYAEEDFTPFARMRDAHLARVLPLKLIHGQTVLHPLLVHKSDGKPYTIFTPFSRAWKALLTEENRPVSAPDFFPHLPELDSEVDIDQYLPVSDGEILFPAGEVEALRRLDHFVEYEIQNYAESRNRMDREGTSALSPYLRFGMLSIRQAAASAWQIVRSSVDRTTAQAAETWLNELIWREFYISILYHFPHVSRMAFNRSLADIAWRNAETEFAAWKAGLTGVPIVDAGMRQLSAAGWMHNRARMIVASYLVKDLLINWQWGESWFMQNLLDGDPAANNGGWQWVAGTGTDAAPYFRIFNPLLQSQNFDPDGNYIRKWVPELASLSTEEIHAPWKKGVCASGYPEVPLVDHAVAKDRTLKAYSHSKILHEQSR